MFPTTATPATVAAVLTLIMRRSTGFAIPATAIPAVATINR